MNRAGTKTVKAVKVPTPVNHKVFDFFLKCVLVVFEFTQRLTGAPESGVAVSRTVSRLSNSVRSRIGLGRQRVGNAHVTAPAWSHFAGVRNKFCRVPRAALTADGPKYGVRRRVTGEDGRRRLTRRLARGRGKWKKKQ